MYNYNQLQHKKFRQQLRAISCFLSHISKVRGACPLQCNEHNDPKEQGTLKSLHWLGHASYQLVSVTRGMVLTSYFWHQALFFQLSIRITLFSKMLEKKVVIAGSSVSQSLLLNHLNKNWLGNIQTAEIEVRARKQIRTDVLQFVLAKETGNKCHIVMWIGHICSGKKTTKQYWGYRWELKSYWNCLEAAQVDSVLRWITIYVISQGKPIVTSKGVFLPPSYLQTKHPFRYF